MKDMKELKGVVCANITPFREDGELDEASLRRLLRRLAGQGIHGVYPCGTNGEGLSLTEAERRRAAEIAVEECGGKSVVYLQCGAASPAETRNNVLAAKEAGADGVGIMTPVFFPCDDGAMLRYFGEMLEAAPELPAYIYDIPPRTGSHVSPEVFRRLAAEHENLLGIKFSMPDLLCLQDYLCAAPRRVNALIGCDRLAACCMALGGVGWVSGPSAVFGPLHLALYRAVTEGNRGESLKLQKEIWEICAALAKTPEIPAIKYLLKKLGVIACDFCRAPFRPLTEEEKSLLDSLLLGKKAAAGAE